PSLRAPSPARASLRRQKAIDRSCFLYLPTVIHQAATEVPLFVLELLCTRRHTLRLRALSSATAMPRISNILPLPGIPELESVAHWFADHLKRDANVENGKRTALSRRLNRLLEHTKILENPAKLTSWLLEIQTQLQAVVVSGPRLGVGGAQRKLELWDKLTTELDESMEENMESLLKHHFDDY
ncbi:hypothetical protein BDV93DRAFT_286978, partial [Ceratobasidium sp. AG-I]